MYRPGCSRNVLPESLSMISEPSDTIVLSSLVIELADVMSAVYSVASAVMIVLSAVSVLAELPPDVPLAR